VWSEVWEALVVRLVWRRCSCEIWIVEIERDTGMKYQMIKAADEISGEERETDIRS
jgi:hypothetical protein